MSDIVLIIVVTALLFLLFIPLICMTNDTEPNYLFITLAFVMTIFLASITVYFIRYEHIANLEAFNDATLKAYTYTIDESENIHIKFSESKSMVTLLDAGKLSYLELGKEVSERLKELRDKVEGYNNSVATYNRMNKHPVLGLFYPEIPERLSLIILE